MKIKPINILGFITDNCFQCNVFLLLLIWNHKYSTATELTIKHIVPENYSYLTPPVKDGKPVEVNINLKVLNVRALDESDMTFSASVELWQYWSDERLIYPSWINETMIQLVDGKWKRALWNPKACFLNSVDGKMDNIISPASFFWFENNRLLYYYNRMSLKLSCEMDLKDFPHDIQQCEIKLSSALFDDTEIVFKWGHAMPKDNKRALGLPQFELGEILRGECLHSRARSNVSCLESTVTLIRRSGYFVINVYIPTILIVVMSMLTFWIPPDAVPARVTLGVTSLLTIITKQYQASLPSVSYIVALNVWLSCCIGFVFCSLLEYATVIALTGREKKAQSGGPGQDSVLPMVQLEINGTWKVKKTAWTREKIFTPRLLDTISRIAFPISFLILCIVYFSAYY